MFNKYTHILYNCALDQFEHLVLYTVEHTLDSPNEKTYWVHWFPIVKPTVNYDRLTIWIKRSASDADRQRKRFYHNAMFHNRKLCYFVCATPKLKLMESDFKVLNYLSMQLGAIDITQCITRLYSNFTLTADHLCCLFGESRGTSVVAITNDLDEIIFKDIDRVN